MPPQEISTSIGVSGTLGSIARAVMSGSQSYVVLKAIMAFWVVPAGCGSVTVFRCNPGTSNPLLKLCLINNVYI